MQLAQRFSSLGFQLTAGFVGLILLFAGAGVYAIGAFNASWPTTRWSRSPGGWSSPPSRSTPKR
jgi:hypothetical protein